MNARVALALGVVLAAGAWALWRGRDDCHELPRPADASELDPLVAQKLAAELASARRQCSLPAAWLRLGRVFEANGLAGEAELAYAGAAERAAQDPEILFHWARARERVGDLEGAVAILEGAGDRPLVRWLLAWWRLDLGRTAAARAALEGLGELAHDPGLVPLARARLELAQGNLEAAEALLSAQEIAASPQAAYASVLRAAIARERGEFENAARLQRASRPFELELHDPWSAAVGEHATGFAAMRLDAGRALRAGRFAQAAQLLERVVAHDPGDPSAWNQLARARSALGDADGSLQALERVLELAPLDSDGAFNLARLVLQTRAQDHGLLARAAQRVEVALASQPQDVELARLLQELQSALARLP